MRILHQNRHEIIEIYAKNMFSQDAFSTAAAAGGLPSVPQRNIKIIWCNYVFYPLDVKYHHKNDEKHFFQQSFYPIFEKHCYSPGAKQESGVVERITRAEGRP